MERLRNISDGRRREDRTLEKRYAASSGPAGYLACGNAAYVGKKPDARYIRSSTGGGRWEFDRKLPDSWNVSWRNLTFAVRPMNFKHTGLIPRTGGELGDDDRFNQAGKPPDIGT